jgi:predicted O-methyltransferase YrrM
MQLKIPTDTTASGLASLGETPTRFEQWSAEDVAVETLDAVVESLSLQSVDFIKIDTEGHELFVLRGAENTLKKFKPLVLAEFNAANTVQNGYLKDRIPELMLKWGYLYREVGNEDLLFYPAASVELSSLSQENTRAALALKNISRRKAEIFSSWLTVIQNCSRRLYYRDQSVSSLIQLDMLAQETDPTVIIEVGTFNGISLRTWLRASNAATIHSFDLSFGPLKESRNVLELDDERVRYYDSDVLKESFTGCWTEQDRVIFYVNAHDAPNAPIMNHILKEAIPLLPENSVVVVDDVWFCPLECTADNAQMFFGEVVSKDIDTTLSMDAWYASYHKGGFFVGFREISPLLQFINERKWELRGDGWTKVVCFVVTKQGAKDDGDPFSTASGSILYDPACLLKSRVEKKALLYLSLGVLQTARDILSPATHLSETAAAWKNDLGAMFQSLVPARPFDKRRHGLTVFTIPKPFEGHIGMIQRNAIISWTLLEPRPEIVLCGSEPGTEELAKELGLKHQPDIKYNDMGTPLLDSIFGIIQDLSETDVLMYVNADIILLGNLKAAVESLWNFDRAFLCIGERCNLDVTEAIDFTNKTWRDDILAKLAQTGHSGGIYAIDYFIFTPGLWPYIPPFAIGRFVWDNWLVGNALGQGKKVVDATRYIKCIHQNHAYAHGLSEEALRESPETKRNKVYADRSLMGKLTNTPFFLDENARIERDCVRTLRLWRGILKAKRKSI